MVVGGITDGLVLAAGAAKDALLVISRQTAEGPVVAVAAVSSARPRRWLSEDEEQTVTGTLPVTVASSTTTRPQAQVQQQVSQQHRKRLPVGSPQAHWPPLPRQNSPPAGAFAPKPQSVMRGAPSAAPQPQPQMVPVMVARAHKTR